MNLKYLILSVPILVVGLQSQAKAQWFSLGTAQSFAVLGASTVTNTGTTLLTGDLGVSPGTAITGFGGTGNGAFTGTEHLNDTTAQQAHSDVLTSYSALAALPDAVDLTGQDLGGLVLLPGVYKFSSSAQLTGTLVLNAQNNADALYVFQIGSTLTTAASSNITFINGGSAGNLFWQVGSSATFGTSTAFQGNVLAFQDVSVASGVGIDGRLLTEHGAVTLIDDTITTAALPMQSGQPGTFTSVGSAAAPEPGSLVMALTVAVPAIGLILRRRRAVLSA